MVQRREEGGASLAIVVVAVPAAVAVAGISCSPPAGEEKEELARIWEESSCWAPKPCIPSRICTLVCDPDLSRTDESGRAEAEARGRGGGPKGEGGAAGPPDEEGVVVGDFAAGAIYCRIRAATSSMASPSVTAAGEAQSSMSVERALGPKQSSMAAR